MVIENFSSRQAVLCGSTKSKRRSCKLLSQAECQLDVLNLLVHVSNDIFAKLTRLVTQAISQQLVGLIKSSLSS